MTEFTIDRLRTTMRSCVGVEDDVDLDGPIEDTPFDELGYDSLALLEVLNQLHREFGIDVPDDAITDLPTPASVVGYVNQMITSTAGV
ncbi:MAG: acyl carrier protein [Pseudonocardia sp.]|nr:acyl carrier protein [Pseudonocardia sp.]